MRFTYRLVREKDGFVAECFESEAAGEGKTEALAVESLRKVLEERMFRPDAVAPPPKAPPGANGSAIELVHMPDSATRPTLDLGGPGEAPIADDLARS